MDKHTLSRKRFRDWRRQQGLNEADGLKLLLDMVEGKRLDELIASLKRSHAAGFDASQLAMLNVLYSWLAYIFSYTPPD